MSNNTDMSIVLGIISGVSFLFSICSLVVSFRAYQTAINGADDIPNLENIQPAFTITKENALKTYNTIFNNERPPPTNPYLNIVDETNHIEDIQPPIENIQPPIDEISEEEKTPELLTAPQTPVKRNKWRINLF